MENTINSGAAVAKERKVREQKTERVKLTIGQVDSLRKAIAFYRDDILTALPELQANPRFARFANAVESEASELAAISAAFETAEYVAYASPVAGE